MKPKSPFAAVFGQFKEINATNDSHTTFTPFEVDLSWHVRDDGDIDAYDGFFRLEDFAAAGRIDSVQLTVAREIKRKWLERQKTGER